MAGSVWGDSDGSRLPNARGSALRVGGQVFEVVAVSPLERRDLLC